ncbi:MAG TPA: hypothetical protein VHE37_00530 [Nevskiaceae bacterium]|nr:hypothetical protein [Nevskiaceae bacterium]
MNAQIRAGFLLLLLCGATAHAGEDEGDAPKYQALKARSAAPKDADINPAVTLGALLSQSGEKDWSTDRAARIEGYVIQVELEPDGDVHLVLAGAAHEPDTRKWVVTEVPKAVRDRSKSLSVSALRKLVGRQVHVTGWMYWEPDDDSQDPRGTRWELHPVTSVMPTGS